MSITEELREYAGNLAGMLGASVTDVKSVLEDIADRIDEKHESVCCEIADKFDGWVIPPKDADGETIHLQDRMSWDNGTFNVHELNLTADGWTTWDELHGYTVRADQCRHVQPDSWERIIRDAQGDGILNQIDGRPSDFEALVERCKRLAGEGA